MAENPLSVLLVEDSAGLSELIGLWLERYGEPAMTVHYADRLAAAEAKLDQVDVDAVLLDLTLPDSEGLETVHRVLERVPDVPIVVLTGASDPELAIGALRAGAEDYLFKGHMDENMLRRALLYAVERRRRAAEAGEVAAGAGRQARERSRLSDLVEALSDGPPLASTHPEVKANLGARYRRLLEGLDGPRESGDAFSHAVLSSLASALAELGAGPADVVAFHLAALGRERDSEVPPGRQEEERLLLLELMGRVMACYRNAARR